MSEPARLAVTAKTGEVLGSSMCELGTENRVGNREGKNLWWWIYCVRQDELSSLTEVNFL